MVQFDVEFVYKLRDFITHNDAVGTFVEKHKLKLGCYVQEFAIDKWAAETLIELINKNPKTYVAERAKLFEQPRHVAKRKK